jgi:hypothetical protein
MLAASGLLFYEGVRENAAHTAGGALVGALFVAVVARRSPRTERSISPPWQVSMPARRFSSSGS